jgi:hypothetical protein
VNDPGLRVVRRGCYEYLKIRDAECRGRTTLDFAGAAPVSVADAT